MTNDVYALTYTVSIPEGSGVPGCEETDECFSPYLVTIQVGDTIVWTNDDTAAHTVTSGNPTYGPDDVFHSSLYMTGDTFSHSFDSSGLFAYFDIFHPWMQGIVQVTEKDANEYVEEQADGTPSGACPIIGPIMDIKFFYEIEIAVMLRDYGKNKNFEEYLQGIDYRKSEKISAYVQSILQSEYFAVMYFEKDLSVEEEKLMIQVSEKYLEYLYDGKNRLISYIKTGYLDTKNEMNALPMQDSRFTICGEDKTEGLEELESIKKTAEATVDLYVTPVIEDWEKELEFKKQSFQIESPDTIEQTTSEPVDKTTMVKTGEIGLKKGDWVKYQVSVDVGQGLFGLMAENFKNSMQIPETECTFSEIEWFKVEVSNIQNNIPVFQKSLFCDGKETLVEEYGSGFTFLYIPIDINVGDIVDDGSEDPPKVIGIEEKQYGGKKIQVIKLHSETKETYDTGSLSSSKTHYFDKTSGLLLESDMKMYAENIPFMGDLDVEMGFVALDYNIPRTSSLVNGGGCLIATATFGSELAPQVQQLREIRDNSLLQTKSGSAFMESFNQFYYSFSPGIADLERENPVFKEIVKLAITPLLTSLSILNYVDMDSEETVLGYGISLILLNIGMYFVAPALIVIRIFRIKCNSLE